MEGTLMARWSAINGWTMPIGIGAEVVKKNRVLRHMQGEHGKNLALAGYDKSDERGHFAALNQWVVEERNWQVADSSFVTASAGDLKRGPEHALVEIYMMYVTDRASFEAKAKSNPTLQKQYDFIQAEFFGNP